MLQHLELELKRESEAAEQRMTHKLQRIVLELSREKTAAIAAVRQEEREKIAEFLTKQEKYLEQIQHAGQLAHEIYQKNLQQLAWEKKHEMEVALTISQIEFQEETEKLLKVADATRETQLEEVISTVNRKDSEILSLSQQVKHMTAWKDSLEAEILETREAFQKYIDLTFPQLAPGQADFILPFRKVSPFTDYGENRVSLL
uniref:Chromosome 6 open reading frame 163 n=1 Tax=Varanus komodoensis TaxID=61221 RepID=A0A8D2JLL2_VARKO